MNLIVLSRESKFDLVAAGASSAGTAVDSSSVDMQGYESVAFFCSIATANAGNFLKASQSSDDGSSDAFSDLEGSKVIAESNGDVVLLEVMRPQKRYVKAHVIRAGANTVTGDIYALRYNGKKHPQVNDVTNVLNRVYLREPAEGTA